MTAVNQQILHKDFTLVDKILAYDQAHHKCRFSEKRKQNRKNLQSIQNYIYE